MLRPGARAALLRFREALAGAAVVALGLWWAGVAHGAIAWIGWILAAAGVAGVVAGLQRARFRAGPGGVQGGPGVVRVDEGQIAYFGPLTGGAVARSEIASLALDRQGRPAHWIIRQPGQPDLAIPVTAAGAEALFDAFAALPGLRAERMLAELNRKSPPRDRPVVIWERPADRLADHPTDRLSAPR